MRSSGRSAMTRQSKWTWTPPSFGVSVQTPLPVRSPTTSTSKPWGRSMLAIVEVVFRWYGSWPLNSWREARPTSGAPSLSTEMYTGRHHSG